MSVYANEIQRPEIVVTTGVTSPSLYDTINSEVDGSTVDMMGATAVFFMRPLTSRTPVINGSPAVALAPPDNDGHNVRYDWRTSDVAIEGQYRGWWGYTLPGLQLAESPEFSIIITDHGPGYGTQIGVVVEGIAAFMPITYRALHLSSDFGDQFLQQHADAVKRTVMGTVVAPDLEVNYDPMLVEYLSKRTALRLITPAKDYWARQHRAVQTIGPSEMASYPDMLKNLDDLAIRLKQELVLDWRQLQSLVPGLPQLIREPMPLSSLGDGSDPRNGPVTGDPQATQPARTGGPRWIPWFQF